MPGQPLLHGGNIQGQQGGPRLQARQIQDLAVGDAQHAFHNNPAEGKPGRHPQTVGQNGTQGQGQDQDGQGQMAASSGGRHDRLPPGVVCRDTP